MCVIMNPCCLVLANLLYLRAVTGRPCRFAQRGVLVGTMARGTVAVRTAGLLLAVLSAAISWLIATAQDIPPGVPPWSPIHAPGYCVWYGECGHEPQYGNLNCLYNGPAKPVRSDGTICGRPWT